MINFLKMINLGLKIGLKVKKNKPKNNQMGPNNNNNK